MPDHGPGHLQREILDMLAKKPQTITDLHRYFGGARNVIVVAVRKLRRRQLLARKPEYVYRLKANK